MKHASPLLPQEEAFDILLKELSAVGSEDIPLVEAQGRVLSGDVVARLTHPKRAVSAMDGYAVHSNSIKTVPVDLDVVEVAQAGGALPRSLPQGKACRIFTGAPLPEGADTIVIQENTEKPSETTVRVLQSENPGRFVRPAGLDFSAGDIGIRAGKRLNDRDLALAAAMGYSWLSVRRRPRIGILATGDEVVLPGEPMADNQIISSNTIALTGFVKNQECDPVFLGIARDNEDDLKDKVLSQLAQFDLIVTTGGASVGDFDLVRRLLAEEEETRVYFSKLAVRPGKPVIFAKRRGIPVLALPGNPVSAIVGAHTMLKLALQCLSGLSNPSLAYDSAILGSVIPENDQRMEYMRAELSFSETGTLLVTPYSKQDSGMLSTLQKATALIIRPALSPVMKPGDSVRIIRLDR
ncbi:molybdopterin molybdotransferase MoeA [Kiloniella sp. b19]|uniref:molybdopterin molybdotransferase MoeA n=1 Tax=Kiloniella sp. GXU_MW_B19 TaxID=3141326 RepID=UPI0031E0B340